MEQQTQAVTGQTKTSKRFRKNVPFVEIDAQIEVARRRAYDSGGGFASMYAKGVLQALLWIRSGGDEAWKPMPSLQQAVLRPPIGEDY